MQPLAYNYLNYLSNITVIKSPESSTCCILAPVDSPSITFLLAAQLRKSLNTSEKNFFNSAPVHHTSCKVPFFLKGIVFNWSGTMAWWTLSISEFNRTKLSRNKSVRHELNNFFSIKWREFCRSYHYFDPLAACLRFDFENHVKAYLYDNQWSTLRQFFWTGSKKVLHNQIRNTLKCYKICLSMAWVVIHYVLLSKYSDLS